MFGRGARVYLVPLYNHAKRGGGRLSRRLEAALVWWCRFLEAGPTSRVAYAPPERRRVILYTDATGGGRVAWTLDCGDGRREWAAAQTPRWLRRKVQRRRAQVATWELCAALAAVWALLDREGFQVGECEVLLFVDSNVALGTLRKGYSKEWDWNALAAEFWFRLADAGLSLRAFRVPSGQNLADAPTRSDKVREMREMEAAGFAERRWRWPRRWLERCWPAALAPGPSEG